MTHETDTRNFSMSLEDDDAEAAFAAAVNKTPSSNKPGLLHSNNSSHRELRMEFGRWSHSDKMEWTCLCCTYSNQPLFLACDMCGQPRPAEEGEGTPGRTPASATTSATASIAGDSSHAGNDSISCSSGLDFLYDGIGGDLDLTPAEQRRLMEHQGEEERLKQQRIDEIMNLQQGAYHKIKGSDEEDLEASFAWNDLHDEEEVAVAPAAVSTTASTANAVGVGSSPNGKIINYNGKPNKKAMRDDSSATAATVASSCSYSQFSNYSLRSLDVSDNESRRYQSQNPNGPLYRLEEALGSSLKSNDSFRTSLQRGQFPNSNNKNRGNNSSMNGSTNSLDLLTAEIQQATGIGGPPATLTPASAASSAGLAGIEEAADGSSSSGCYEHEIVTMADSAKLPASTTTTSSSRMQDSMPELQSYDRGSGELRMEQPIAAAKLSRDEAIAARAQARQQARRKSKTASPPPLPAASVTGPDAIFSKNLYAKQPAATGRKDRPVSPKAASQKKNKDKQTRGSGIFGRLSLRKKSKD